MEELHDVQFEANAARPCLMPPDGERHSSAAEQLARGLVQSMRSAAVVATSDPMMAARTVLPHKTSFEELDVVIDQDARIFWQYMKPKGRPSYTPGLLRDMRRALQWLEHIFADHKGDEEAPIRYVVLASRLPGVFNMGGDLPRFVELIRRKDRAALERYARACIDVQYPRAVNLGLPFINISLVQGDALGGGFEATLADDVIIAERSAKFGLPEILFSLFPGMGACSFLTRRIGATAAEKLIFSGQIYTAEQLHAMGVVDVLADDGCGERAVYDYVERIDRTFHARRSVFAARQLVHPITRDELMGVADLWVDAALTLAPNDLRKMERLAAAQDRRCSAMALAS
jgi:DSF synthase